MKIGSKVHVLDVGRSDVIISRIKDHGRKVRCWHNSDGELVGCWQGRNGRTYAVAQKGRYVIAYRAMTPADGWKAGSGDCAQPTPGFNTHVSEPFRTLLNDFFKLPGSLQP